MIDFGVEKKAAKRKRAKRRNIVFLSAAFLLMTMLSACGSGGKPSIIVAGSTSVQPYAEVLAHEYLSLYTEIDIDIQGGGSSAGITATESGTADIGMSSRSMKADEQDLWVVEIAKDGLAVIISPKNPVENLTLKQIRDIYTGKITNWSEVGGKDAKIHVIAREEGSGTRSAFEELVMGTEGINPKSIVQNANGAVRQVVAGDPDAIGFISLGLVDKTVKALQLEGVEATRENIINGSYSLFRSFLFVSAEEPEGPVKEFIDFVLSPKGQEILINEGLIPE